MRKGTLLFVTILLLLLFVTTGCGVAQAEYDAVVADKDAAKAQVASLQAQVTSLQAEVASIEADLNEAKAAKESVQSELDKAKAVKESVESELDKAKANYEDFKSDVRSIFAALGKKVEATAMIGGYWSDSGKVEVGLMSMADYLDIAAVFLSRFGGVLDAVGNPELSEMWEDALIAAAKNDEKGFATKFTAVMDSLTELIKKDVAAMDAKLH